MSELPYPFEDKRAQYAQYTKDQLDWALSDARDVLERAEEMAREGFQFAGRKGPNWRADDIHTISQEINRRRADEGLLGRLITF